jgi:Fatty acid hydroxylase superfamily
MRLGSFSYYADFVGALTCSALLCVLAMLQGTWLLRGEWLASLIIGLTVWTLLEYGIHRWLYHGVEFFIRGHEVHHKEPHAYIGAPPFVGIALIFSAIYVPIGLVSKMVGSGLTTGVLAGYFAYQLVHHATHFWQPAGGSYFYRARLHHLLHHFTSMPTRSRPAMAGRRWRLLAHSTTKTWASSSCPTMSSARRRPGRAPAGFPARDVRGRCEPGQMGPRRS